MSNEDFDISKVKPEEMLSDEQRASIEDGSGQLPQSLSLEDRYNQAHKDLIDWEAKHTKHGQDSDIKDPVDFIRQRIEITSREYNANADYKRGLAKREDQKSAGSRMMKSMFLSSGHSFPEDIFEDISLGQELNTYDSLLRTKGNIEDMANGLGLEEINPSIHPLLRDNTYSIAGHMEGLEQARFYRGTSESGDYLAIYFPGTNQLCYHYPLNHGLDELSSNPKERRQFVH